MDAGFNPSSARLLSLSPLRLLSLGRTSLPKLLLCSILGLSTPRLTARSCRALRMTPRQYAGGSRMHLEEEPSHVHGWQ